MFERAEPKLGGQPGSPNPCYQSLLPSARPALDGFAGNFAPKSLVIAKFSASGSSSESGQSRTFVHSFDDLSTEWLDGLEIVSVMI